MNILATPDRTHYRRWLNPLPTFFVPGSGQYLSGRTKAALLWLAGYVALFGLRWLLIFWPASNYDPANLTSWVHGLLLLYLIAMMIDACRRPMRRIGFTGWFTFFSVYVILMWGPLLFLRQLILQPFKMPTGAMEPTLMGARQFQDEQTEGDHFFVEKISFRLSPPQRGDVVAFRVSGIAGLPPNQIYLKRIAAIPGDTVSIHPPDLLINGQPLRDPPIIAKIASRQDGYPGFALPLASHPNTCLSDTNDQVQLEPDQYFLLGDNSGNSYDSRYWGPVPRRNIIGRAFYIYAPAHRKGWIE